MSALHLLVLVHGMWGNPGHLTEMARVIQESHDHKHEQTGIDLHVLVAQTNSEGFTYDGIDYGGERVATEVLQEVEKLREIGRPVTRISICGYSMGGLIARYLVGILHQRHFFDIVTPVNFYTFASPHVGLPRYPTIRSKIIASLGPKLLARTGKQFFLKDKWSPGGRPLLAIMADPEGVFYKGLCQFRNLTIYANAVRDHTVPYLTAAIELEDPYLAYPANGAEVTLDEKYSFLLTSYIVPVDAPPPLSKPIPFSPRWFENVKAPFMPPAWNVGFPLSILLIISLPILLPIFVGFRLVRITSDTRTSHQRIKSLEAHESHRNSLIHVLAELEKNVEDKVVGVVEDVSRVSNPGAVKGTGRVDNSKTAPKKRITKPTLTEDQKEIVRMLNTLPNLKKETVFMHTVSNSHPAIVCREVEKFKIHGAGAGILQHFADKFVF